jgi:hypothetical protein
VYKTVNAGKSWELETVIPMDVEVDRVYVITNADHDAYLLITEAGDRDIEVPKRDVFIARLMRD